jgi:hypothetical protein
MGAGEYIKVNRPVEVRAWMTENVTSPACPPQVETAIEAVS